MSQTKAQLIDTLVASLLPASDSAVDIGSNAVRFANIYGDTLYGSGANLTGLNIVTDTSPQLGGDLQSNGNDIDFADADKAIFGAGTDLQIFSDGSTCFLKADDLRIRSANNENYQTFTANGAVNLFYDNVKKFETTSTGATITSNGSQNGLSLVHSNGNTSAILRHVGTGDEGEFHLKDGGSTLLYLSGASGGDSNITTGGNFDLEHDSAKLRLGAGNDLQIYHDGSHSRIDDVGTGSLLIQTNGTDVQINKGTSEIMAKFIPDGSVELYYDNSIKLNTNSAGLRFYGSLRGNDTEKIELGSSQDLQIYHDGTDSFIKNTTGNLIIGDTTGNVILQGKFGEDSLICKPDGAVELNFDNTKKFETTSTGVQVTGRIDILGTGTRIDIADNGKIILGDGNDLQILHNGTDSIIDNATNNLFIRSGSTHIQSLTGEDKIVAEADGAVELYYDNSKKLETTSWGTQISGTLKTSGGGLSIITDGEKFTAGAGDDLQIYHNGSNSFIENSTGSLYIRDTSGGDVRIQGKSGEDSIICNDDGAVELYHDNNKKAETFGSGLKVANGGELYIDGNAAGGHCQLIMTRSDRSWMIANETNFRIYKQDGNYSSPDNNVFEIDGTGNVLPGANNIMNLGSSSKRWANVYTNDLNLSNEGSSNDVDGTWGSYTIQEGAEDLFLVNKRSGKKYKFNLTEVL